MARPHACIIALGYIVSFMLGVLYVVHLFGMQVLALLFETSDDMAGDIPARVLREKELCLQKSECTLATVFVVLITDFMPFFCSRVKEYVHGVKEEERAGGGYQADWPCSCQAGG